MQFLAALFHIQHFLHQLVDVQPGGLAVFLKQSGSVHFFQFTQLFQRCFILAEGLVHHLYQVIAGFFEIAQIDIQRRKGENLFQKIVACFGVKNLNVRYKCCAKRLRVPYIQRRICSTEIFVFKL